MTTDEAQQKIKEICDNLKEFLIEKNKNYGNSALEPKRIFSKLDATEQLKIRLDDKMSRIINSDELRKNDIVDVMGYLILLCISKDWMDFKEFID